MNPIAAVFDHPLLRAVPWRTLAVPVLVFMVLVMMILPLPPLLLDLLFTFNIALALVVLMTAVYTKKPLDFAALCAPGRTGTAPGARPASFLPCSHPPTQDAGLRP